MLTRLKGSRKATPRGRRSALFTYAAAWLIAGAVVGSLLILALGVFSDDSVTLPPVRETELTDAARHAGCLLRRGQIRDPSTPPVDARAGAHAARPGVYDRAPHVEMLGAAVRRGTIVIHHRAELPGELLDQLRTLQRAVPQGTIMTVDASGMPYEIAVTAYRRLLACPRFTDQAIEAIRLFQGRFLGSGPDSSR